MAASATGRGRRRITASRRKRYEDPTHTRSTADAYERRLRGAYDNIITVINEWVGEEDVLQLTAAELVAEPPHPDPNAYRFLGNRQKADEFADWIQRAQESEVLSVVTRNENRYVKKAYKSGLESANSDLREAGFDPQTAQEVFEQPIHERKLQTLYSRNFEGTREYGGLVGMADDVTQEVRDELVTGLGEGINPHEIAGRITQRIDAVGKTRAEQIARTEVLNSHNEAFLTRAEQLGVREVQVEAEILTAQDDRVCDECEPRHGETMSIEEARSDGPPWHTQCRCTYRTKISR